MTSTATAAHKSFRIPTPPPFRRATSRIVPRCNHALVTERSRTAHTPRSATCPSGRRNRTPSGGVGESDLWHRTTCVFLGLAGAPRRHLQVSMGPKSLAIGAGQRLSHPGSDACRRVSFDLAQSAGSYSVDTEGSGPSRLGWGRNMRKTTLGCVALASLFVLAVPGNATADHPSITFMSVSATRSPTGMRYRWHQCHQGRPHVIRFSGLSHFIDNVDSPSIHGDGEPRVDRHSTSPTSSPGGPPRSTMVTGH